MSGMMTKAPGDTLDYDIEFHRWLSDADTIGSAVASIENSTATVGNVEASEHAVKVWIAGGKNGETAHVSVTITTVQGRVKEYCFRLRIRDC